MKIKKSYLNDIIKEEVLRFIKNNLVEQIGATSGLIQKLKSEMGPEKLLDAMVEALPESMVLEALRYIVGKQKQLAVPEGD